MVHQETVLLEGHIIDSLILAKVLDRIISMGGSFDLQEVEIGKTREDPSRVKIIVQADSPALLTSMLQAIQPHGASIERESDCDFKPAPADGVFPDEFYATTHLPTEVRVQGVWISVDRIEMDLGILVEPGRATARAIPMASVKRGESVVIGRGGVRVMPLQRPRKRDVFSFMESQVSVERPHGRIIHDIAARMKQLQAGYREGRADCRILFSGGPAIIHAGGRDALTWLIENDFVQVLFCGNALAAHDLEMEFYGTSLGYAHQAGQSLPHGHEHHLRTINRLRAIGSIEKAVESGLVKQGIMAACVRHAVQVVLAGTIRDDGPLPGVITDSIQAQEAMRQWIPGTGLALLVASTLHSVATGNLLPATVPTVCVDINPSVPTKLADRGTFQAVGLVMDAASFLRELSRELGWRV